jgi:hypothetical protein
VGTACGAAEPVSRRLLDGLRLMQSTAPAMAACAAGFSWGTGATGVTQLIACGVREGGIAH